MKRNDWILKILAEQPDPPRVVSLRESYSTDFWTTGNLILILVGLLLLLGGMGGFSTEYSGGDRISFGILVAIGFTFLAFSLLMPVFSVRLIRHAILREAIVQEVEFRQGSDATIESVNNGGIAVGKLRLLDTDASEDDGEFFECDDPWAYRLKNGSRLFVLIHWKTGVVCDILGLKEDIQQTGALNRMGWRPFCECPYL